NLDKHGISFEAACGAFFGPFLVPLADDIVDGEVRHAAVGMTADWQFLFLAYVWRGDTIRLISARRATRYQRKSYENR
ncbi:MAG TPA: BrnT family toxin, partial [Anaerolineae bacterium]|nr:BrnT family toxin [Anaerolineae bacterium]